MKIGDNIKKLRELKNYTQAYMANQLELSLASYGRIERDDTDITISRLTQIAAILETSLSNILNFDSNQVFNQHHNNTANGIVQNQQIIGNENVKSLFDDMKLEIENLKSKIEKLQPL